MRMELDKIGAKIPFKVDPPMRPDENYISARNALIQQAEIDVSEKVKRMDFNSIEEYKAEWDRKFHSIMDELARKHIYQAKKVGAGKR
jgi:hypothetical protein